MKKTQYELFHRKNQIQTRIIKESNFTYRNILSVLSNYLAPNISVLDIGCGAGTLSFYMAEHGCRVLGVDISMETIHKCRENAKTLKLASKVDFLVGDFMSMVFKKRFDLILCSEVVEHLKDDKKALNKIYEYLRLNGVLVLSTPSKNAPLYKLGFAKKFDKNVGHIRRYKLTNLIKVCEGVGFDILETRKTEGILRNSLFIFSFGDIFVRLANKISFFGRFITFIDDIFLKLFGESQLILIGEKKV